MTLSVVQNQHFIQPFNSLSEETLANLNHSISPNTLKGYLKDLGLTHGFDTLAPKNSYRHWIEKEGITGQLPHSPDIVANYLSFLDSEGLKPATLQRRLRAISWLHKTRGYGQSNPAQHQLVTDTLKGLKRRRASEGKSNAPQQKAPARADAVSLMADHCDQGNIAGLRDRALLLVGFAASLRRSELVALEASDIVITPKGADIHIRKSKGDQEGMGATVSIIRGKAHCPVKALLDWLEAAGIQNGPVFRRIRRGGSVDPEKALTDQSVALVIKRYCKAAGLNSSVYSGHSLRSGMLTSAAENGADLIPLAQHARHKDPKQTLHYINQANRYNNNPTEGLL
ncbi:MAG: site-specific integrase [Endozoicomonas sp.]|uniref:site-specific integrase n=1 Tax=Endozoicomonas sp. TaxID=1892382 RepID=UPI003D9BDAC2